MGVQWARRATARGPRDFSQTDLATWGYGAAIGTLIALAALLLTACSGERLGDVSGDLDANPSPLDFGVVAVERTAEKKFVLKNRGSAPLRILAIEPVGTLASAFHLPDPPTEPIPVAGSAEVVFRFTPDDEARYAGRILVHTDSTRGGSASIAVGGEGARPKVQCTGSLDFGRIVLNTEKTLRIACMNTGKVEAEVRVAGKEGEDPQLFTVGENLVDGAAIIPVGESRYIDVRYTAAFLGTATARAVLEIVGALEPRHVVELTGQGFASDLVATPNCIHFGPVSPGSTATRQVMVYNGGNQTVTFESPRLTDTSDVFAIHRIEVNGSEKPLDQLGPDEQAVLTLGFTPTAVGTYAGSLQLRSDDRTNPRLEVCITGQGGGAEMIVEPPAIHFGDIAVGMRARAWVTVRNGGTSEGGPLRITGVEVDQPGTFTVYQPQVTELNPGADFSLVEVEFHPQANGAYAGTLTIRSNDGDTPAVMVPLTGGARELPPCSYRAEPPSLRFGNVQTGSTAVLAAALRNIGTDDCVFASVMLATGTSPVFSLPGGPIGVATVAPGQALEVPVRFDASAAGSFSGAVGFYVSDPTNPQGTIPITARSMTGCLVATPGAVDFGEQRISCPAVTRTIRLENRCASTLELQSIALGEGIGNTAEIALVGLPALPLNLGPGGATNFSLRYDPVDDGHDAVPLVITSSALEIDVPVHGLGTSSDQRTDTFRQSERSAVDVLFVVDNSGSMMEEQTAVGQAFEQFIQYAVAQGIDYHIGVTTTGITPSGGGWAACPGGVDGGEAGRLFPATGERPRYITPTTPNAVQVFRDNVQVGVCHWWEEGLEAAYRAVSPPLVDSADAPNTRLPADGNLGFYRPDARLSVIVVTDEDDHSDKEPSFYINFFRTLKGAANADRVTMHGVLGDGCSTASGTGDRYKAVITATGGTTESICTTDWGRSLVNLAQETFGFSLRFPLSGVPVGGITVTVDGQVVNGWTWDAASNQVVFTESTAPAPGTRVDITYTPACGT